MECHSEILVEAKAPIPEFIKKRGRDPKYPFRKCSEVGMSFFVPAKTKKTFGHNVSRYNDVLSPWKFEYEITSNNGVRGVRIWRVK